ncbi:MAG: D-alanyl-D-alanine carboxypeptidase [Ruminococcaceae bacterium]|nr:D-alanyl-D-alanine carboxypeptidase [Oscillospiraceae bacterium]
MRYVKKYKGIFAFLLTFAFILQYSSFLRVSADFVPVVDKIYSEGVYMVNLDTDVVIYSKNENQRFYPASITKIMTAVVVLENCPNLDATVRIGYEATNEFWSSDLNKQGPSTAALEAGQTNITYRDCLYALMLASACEAANILALNLCGSIENFTALMNNKAKQLGCLDTHFSNAHGLWEAENYSTPYDMYLISRYAYDRVPNFMEICDTYSYAFPANQYNPDGYTKYTTNPLITPSSDFYLDYVHGIKTGSIDVYYDKDGNVHDGGRCLVTTAQKNGYTYLLVTMQAPFYNEENKAYNYSALDHYNLYEWAYKSFTYKEVVTKGEICTELDVEQGEEDRIQLAAEADFTTIVPSDLVEGSEDGPVQRKRTLLYEKVVAPVKKGEVLGRLDIVYQGDVIKTIDLVASKSIERSQIAYLVDRAKSLTETSWFSPLLVLLLICILTDIVLMAIRRRRLIQEARRNERMRRRKNMGR